MQITVDLGSIERTQKVNGDMKIHPPWVKGSYQLCNCDVPIVLIMVEW